MPMKEIVFSHERRIIEISVDIEFMNSNKDAKILFLNSDMVQ